AYFQQSNPLDDNGNPVKNGHTGAVVTSPLITSSMFLNAINYGFEVDYVHSNADSFVTGHGTQILMQNEVTSPPGVTVAPNFSVTGSSFAHGSKLTVNMTSGTFPARNFGTAPWLYDTVDAQYVNGVNKNAYAGFTDGTDTGHLVWGQQSSD